MRRNGITRYVDLIQAKRVEARIAIVVGVALVTLSPIGFIASVVIAVIEGEAGYLLIFPLMLIGGALAVIIGKVMDWVYNV